MLRRYEEITLFLEKQNEFVTALDLNKCLKQVQKIEITQYVRTYF